MSRFLRLVQIISALTVVHSFSLTGQTVGKDELAYPGSDVVWPKAAHREEATYPKEALQVGTQGDVLIAATIDTAGIARDPIILSPLGNGLDERAVECLYKWRFTPATRNGNAVKFRATIEISFRIAGRSFDTWAERRRVGATAVATLLSRQENGKPSDDSLWLMRLLADNDWEQAEYQVGLWQIKGDVLPKDGMAGLKAIRKAAEKSFPPAMVFVGDALLEGKGMPQNMRKGLSFLRKAAAAGSVDAEQDLGGRYLDGRGLKPDAREARKYLGLCSQAGRAECRTLADRLSKQAQ